jgi:hypothetical protein
MNTNYSLSEAIPDSELRHINFFNGRLLTGGDLEDEQSAQHAHSRHLGMAIGDGIAFGLRVTRADSSPPDSPMVSVTKGLAVNRAGQTLRLECNQLVALTRAPDPGAKDECIFTDCDPASGGATIMSGAGYYVLTIGPASRSDGMAQVSGLGNTTAICNSRYSAEGVKFGAFRLSLPVNGTPAARSLLAKACFGLAPGISSAASWPGALPAPHEYGWEKLMPPGFEATVNVALAVFEWTSTGLGFVWRWPVRRRIARHNPVSDWAYFTSERRVAEGEAMFLEFQNDLGGNPPAGYAGNRFALLPPGGILPPATTWKTFLGPMAPPFLTPIDASLWPGLLRDTFAREPVEIPASGGKNPGAPTRAALKVYKIPERPELLFARSPLGRLRVFRNEDVDDATIILAIRDANGCFRTSALSEHAAWPAIADDLPGGVAQVWFLFAGEWDNDFLTRNEIQKAGGKKVKKAARASNPGEEDIAIGGGIIPDPKGPLRMGLLVGTLGQWLKNPDLTVNIVNGRTTDVEIPAPSVRDTFGVFQADK